APTDEAFEKVPKLADFLHNTERVSSVMRNHLVKDRAISIADLAHETTLAMYSGETVTGKDGKLKAAAFTLTYMAAKNGMVQGSDRVLMTDNVSVLRETAEKVEEGLKSGAAKAGEALKSGSAKVQESLQEGAQKAEEALKSGAQKAEESFKSAKGSLS